jgi:hypothetical protein
MKKKIFFLFLKKYLAQRGFQLRGSGIRQACGFGVSPILAVGKCCPTTVLLTGGVGSENAAFSTV